MLDPAERTQEATMYCPNCRMEYQTGVTRCPDCDVALMEELPPEDYDEAEWVDLVTVLETGDPVEIDVAKSLLEAEGIACFATGEGLQEFVGLGRLPGGTNLAVGPVRLQVRSADEETARSLLASRNFEESEGGEE
jgi:putative signal transducing protein